MAIDLTTLMDEGFALAASCTRAEAQDWLHRERAMRQLYGEFANLIVADAMAAYRARTGFCPTCGGDAVTHEALTW